MKNILLCDANFCVLPVFESLKKLEYSVSVAGSRLDDPAHQLADKSVNIDYSDIDSFLKHMTQENYDGIVPGCNDRSYMSSAYVAEKLKFPGFDSYETTLTIHHKDRFRSFADKHQYPVPRAITSLDDWSMLRFPVLVKPIDSFSGKGINKAETVEELKIYWEEAKKYTSTGMVVAEEFIEGKLFSHSAFIKNKKIVIDFFVNEHCTVYPYQVNSSNVSTLLSDNIIQGLRLWTEKFAEDLDLCDGLIHTQFISDNEDFSLIEIARRCPGDLYSELIKKSTGVDYAKLYAMPFCGVSLPDTLKKRDIKYMSRHTVSVDRECIFISSGINIENRSIQNVQLKNSGEKLNAAPFDKSGIYFVEHGDAASMEIKTEKLKNFISIETLEYPLKEDFYG